MMYCTRQNIVWAILRTWCHYFFFRHYVQAYKVVEFYARLQEFHPHFGPEFMNLLAMCTLPANRLETGIAARRSVHSSAGSRPPVHVHRRAHLQVVYTAGQDMDL